MVGIVIVTHGDFGVSMMRTAESILGRQEQAVALSLPPDWGLEDLQGALKEAFQAVDRGAGALVLVDIPGGTPCNASLPFCLGPGREVLTGLSLPVLLESFLLRGSLPLGELAAVVQEKGRQSLMLMSRRLRP